MSNTTPTIMIPPAGTDAPSQLQVAGQNLFPNASGEFVIEAQHLAQMLAYGWRIKNTDPAHTP